MALWEETVGYLEALSEHVRRTSFAELPTEVVYKLQGLAQQLQQKAAEVHKIHEEFEELTKPQPAQSSSHSWTTRK